MNGFYYYVADGEDAEKRSQLSLADVRAWGLGYAFDDKPDFRGCLNGPDAGHGLTFADRRLGGLGYHKDEQTWRQIPPALLSDNAPPIWVGYAHDRKPGPADLIRRDVLTYGHTVRLEDGNNWTAPCALVWQAEPPTWLIGLPAVGRMNDEGEFEPIATKAKYDGLLKVATDFRQHFYNTAASGDEQFSFEFSGAYKAAIICLQANYRVCRTEVDMLQLIDEAACKEILEAAIDRPTVLSWSQKKTEQDRAGGDSSAGPAD